MSVLNDDLLLRLETERPDVGLVGRIVQLESGVLTGCGRRSVTAIIPCGAVVSNSRVAVAVRAGEVGSADRQLFQSVAICLSLSQRAVCIPCVVHTQSWFQPKMDRLSPCSLHESVCRFSSASR
jgi:hypothetical protein